MTTLSVSIIIDILENCDIHVTVENDKKFVTQKNAGNNF